MEWMRDLIRNDINGYERTIIIRIHTKCEMLEPAKRQRFYGGGGGNYVVEVGCQTPVSLVSNQNRM